MTPEEALAALDAVELAAARERAESERRRTNPTMTERAERIAVLRAGYGGHILNELLVASFKRRIRTIVELRLAHTPLWASLHSAAGHNTAHAHEGTYPCTHVGVLIGFCSPEFAIAFEALVAGGHLTVEIDFGNVGRHYDDWGIPAATVRSPVSRLH